MTESLFSYSDASMPPVKRGLIRLVEAATGQRRLRRIYHDQRCNTVSGESFFGATIRSLALKVVYDPQALDRLPKSGPVVIVSNHPYGVLDGIVISWLVQQVRPDFLVLTHAALLRAPETAGYLLPVDFSGTAEAMRTNLRSRTAARRHLGTGGCVIVFPSGGISTSPDRLGRRRAVDGPWQPFTAQLIQSSRAMVLPMCFEGQNSRLFQIASHMSQSLRLSLIFHEVRSRIGTTLRVAIGEPIDFSAMAGFRDRQALLDHLRNRTYGLESRFPASGEGAEPVRRRDRMLSRLRALKVGRRSASASSAPAGRQPRPR